MPQIPARFDMGGGHWARVLPDSFIDLPAKLAVFEIHLEPAWPFVELEDVIDLHLDLPLIYSQFGLTATQVARFKTVPTGYRDLWVAIQLN